MHKTQRCQTYITEYQLSNYHDATKHATDYTIYKHKNNVAPTTEPTRMRVGCKTRHADTMRDDVFSKTGSPAVLLQLFQRLLSVPFMPRPEVLVLRLTRRDADIVTRHCITAFTVSSMIIAAAHSGFRLQKHLLAVVATVAVMFAAITVLCHLAIISQALHHGHLHCRRDRKARCTELVDLRH